MEHWQRALSAAVVVTACPMSPPYPVAGRAIFGLTSRSFSGGVIGGHLSRRHVPAAQPLFEQTAENGAKNERDDHQQH